MAHPRLRATVPFLLLAALGLALAWPALGWPMTYDDLHLVRSFSAAEIARAFAGNWDPDDMENAGLRPLFVLFDHVRYAAFGEHVAAQRVFLVSLFAGYLALLVRPLARLGIGAAEALAAGMLCLFSRFSVYHYAFLTDGAQLVQAVCFALALGAPPGPSSAGRGTPRSTAGAVPSGLRCGACPSSRSGAPRRAAARRAGGRWSGSWPRSWPALPPSSSRARTSCASRSRSWRWR